MCLFACVRALLTDPLSCSVVATQQQRGGDQQTKCKKKKVLGVINELRALAVRLQSNTFRQKPYQIW
jgi:hypothetical protein